MDNKNDDIFNLSTKVLQMENISSSFDDKKNTKRDSRGRDIFLHTTWYSIHSKKEGKDKDKSVKQNALDTKQFKSIKASDHALKFAARYMGKRPCHGLSGLEIIRGPVDDIVNETCLSNTEDDHSFVNIALEINAITMEKHRLNTKSSFENLEFPIRTISFAIQDPKYCRIIAFVEAKRLARHHFITECHVVLFTDPYKTRKFILTLQKLFDRQRIKMEDAKLALINEPESVRESDA